MRRKKNIILDLQNITNHFTGSAKIVTLSLVIIMLSFANIINTSALSYQSNVGIDFTFNPTLSVNISPSDLIIPNLAPGTTSDSNSINVSVATNASYGYTLSATVGDSLHNNTNLTHTNSTNIFSSIATDADLPSLTTDNTWGYNTSLDSGSTWSNYNGLSNSSNTTLLDKDSNISSSIDFRIGAKASPVQPSGTYTNTITFIAVTKPTPITLSEAYASEGKTMINGYYTMQDMTSTICEKTEAIGAQLRVLDKRDNKLYWISKLADNHCWMTQNLDLDLDSNRTYTHWDTDLGWSTDNDSNIDEDATWRPSHSTIDFDGANTNQVPGWVNSNTEPYSANPGDIYYYTSGTEENDIKYNSLQECIIAGHNDCAHYHAGNYYNWSAAVGSNNTSELTSGSAPDSACASGWEQDNFSFFTSLANAYNINKNNPLILRNAPLYTSRPGNIYSGKINNYGLYGYYWYNHTQTGTVANFMRFSNTDYNTNSGIMNRRYGFSIRCIAR